MSLVDELRLFVLVVLNAAPSLLDSLLNTTCRQRPVVGDSCPRTRGVSSVDVQEVEAVISNLLPRKGVVFLRRRLAFRVNYKGTYVGYVAIGRYPTPFEAFKAAIALQKSAKNQRNIQCIVDNAVAASTESVASAAPSPQVDNVVQELLNDKWKLPTKKRAYSMAFAADSESVSARSTRTPSPIAAKSPPRLTPCALGQPRKRTSQKLEERILVEAKVEQLKLPRGIFFRRDRLAFRVKWRGMHIAYVPITSSDAVTTAFSVACNMRSNAEASFPI